MTVRDFQTYQLVTLWRASFGNPQLKSEIEHEFKERIRDNKNFSIEDLFDTMITHGKRPIIHFIPTSDSHVRYGDFIRADELIVLDSIKQTMDKNKGSNPPQLSYGILMIKAAVKNDSGDNELKEIEINTNEIFELA
jgi:hypothetical protein